MDKEKNNQNFKTGQILPVYHDGVEGKRLEGWAKLIKPKSLPLSLINSDLKETDKNEVDYNVTLKQKWLIIWVTLEELGMDLNFSDRITQRTLAGKKCDRYLYMDIGTWEQVKQRKDLFSSKNHILDQRKFYENNDTNKNIIF